MDGGESDPISRFCTEGVQALQFGMANSSAVESNIEARRGGFRNTISVRLSSHLIERIDVAAIRSFRSRNAWLCQAADDAIFLGLDHGEVGGLGLIRLMADQHEIVVRLPASLRNAAT